MTTETSTGKRKGCLACGRPIPLTEFYCDDECREDAARFMDADSELEMHDDSCGECGHPYKRGDETHYPECPQIFIGM